MTTQLQGEDLLRMVCYVIGGDAEGIDKATLLRRVESTLLDHAKRCVVALRAVSRDAGRRP